MSQYIREPARKPAPVVVELTPRTPRTPPDVPYEFDDTIDRASPREHIVAWREEGPDEEDVVDMKPEIDEVDIGSNESQTSSNRRRRLGRQGYEEPLPVPVTFDDSKSPEDTGYEFFDISYTAAGERVVLKGVSAAVAKGEMLAVLGPPGSGKNELIHCLGPGGGAGITGQILFEGLTKFDPRSMSYLPKGDSLLGSLTVRETIAHALRLSVVESPMHPRDIDELVNTTINALGLSYLADSIVGTMLQPGLSDCDKRKVTIGSSVVAYPKILLLDEPTTGLDSASARVVMTAVKKIARETGMVVIASICQPSYELLQLFDNLLLLAKGKMVYSDRTDRLPDYMASLGYPVPHYANPVDFVMDLMNPDFNNEDLSDWLTVAWKCSQSPKNTLTSSFWADPTAVVTNAPEVFQVVPGPTSFGGFFRSVGILTWRGLTRYRRDMTVYGVRLGMYVLVAMMFAAIFVKIRLNDENINDRLSVHFYVIALGSMMSAAGIPSFLEERAVFLRERKNGLYSSLAFTIANFAAMQPYLMGCTLFFSLIMYWAVGLNSTSLTQGFNFILALYLAVSAAESQVVLIAALVPHTLAAIAITFLANSFWMSMQGHLIRSNNIPIFWFCWAHWIDFQTYAYQVMVRNDFLGLTFQCPGTPATGCQCSFPSTLLSETSCAVSGEDVLTGLGINHTDIAMFLAILFSIVVVYRALIWMVLVWRK